MMTGDRGKGDQPPPARPPTRDGLLMGVPRKDGLLPGGDPDGVLSDTRSTTCPSESGGDKSSCPGTPMNLVSNPFHAALRNMAWEQQQREQHGVTPTAALANAGKCCAGPADRCPGAGGKGGKCMVMLIPIIDGWFLQGLEEELETADAADAATSIVASMQTIARDNGDTHDDYGSLHLSMQRTRSDWGTAKEAYERAREALCEGCPVIRLKPQLDQRNSGRMKALHAYIVRTGTGTFPTMCMTKHAQGKVARGILNGGDAALLQAVGGEKEARGCVAMGPGGEREPALQRDFAVPLRGRGPQWFSHLNLYSMPTAEQGSAIAELLAFDPSVATRHPFGGPGPAAWFLAIVRTGVAGATEQQRAEVLAATELPNLVVQYDREPEVKVLR